MRINKKTIKTILDNNEYDFENLRYKDLLSIFNDQEEFETVDEFRDYVLENIVYEAEILYYATAMDYLKKDDPSLKISLELASDMWYKPEDLNSEKLATMLYQDNLTDELNKLCDIIKEEE